MFCMKCGYETFPLWSMEMKMAYLKHHFKKNNCMKLQFRLINNE